MSVRPTGMAGTQTVTPALRGEGLHKRFGAVTALHEVSFSIRAGEFVTLLGPSGCGKSTILRIVAGIETPTRGSVRIHDREVTNTSTGLLVPPERRDLSMVFQSYAVWPHMTVGANVAFPLRYRKVPRRDRNTLVTEALAAVRMAEYADRYPHQLSGGQQQRVAVARSIVSRPALLLLDEPLSNLDARLREDMRVELKRLHVELGLTMLYVTHDQAEALAMSDRILVMDQGVVLQEGTPEDVYRAPESLPVARFLGVKNILDAQVVGHGLVQTLGAELRVSDASADAMDQHDVVAVAIRPDGFVPADPGPEADGSSIRGRIQITQFLGGLYEHEVDTSGATLVVQTPQSLGERGDTVNLRVEPSAVMVFPPENPPK